MEELILNQDGLMVRHMAHDHEKSSSILSPGISNHKVNFSALHSGKSPFLMSSLLCEPYGVICILSIEPLFIHQKAPYGHSIEIKQKCAQNGSKALFEVF